MTIRKIIERLLEEDGASASQLIAQALEETMQGEGFLTEASVHRPRRGKVFVAYFTGAEPGQQVSRSTKLTDYHQALALAKKWERQARAQRKAQGHNKPKPTLRVHGSTRERTSGPFTQGEIAILLDITERAVRTAEKRGMKKLLNHPELRQVWQQYLAGELLETPQELTPAEEAAVVALARTSTELYVIKKALRIVKIANYLMGLIT